MYLKTYGTEFCKHIYLKWPLNTADVTQTNTEAEEKLLIEAKAKMLQYFIKAKKYSKMTRALI